MDAGNLMDAFERVRLRGRLLLSDQSETLYEDGNHMAEVETGRLEDRCGPRSTGRMTEF